MLSKTDILDCKDIETEVVKVPEWGGEVLVQGISLTEKDAYRKSLTIDGEIELDGATARLCTMCMVDEDGKRLFEEIDIAALSTKSAAAIERIFQVAQRLSGMDQEEIKDAVKNSEKTTTPASD